MGVIFRGAEKLHPPAVILQDSQAAPCNFRTTRQLL